MTDTSISGKSSMNNSASKPDKPPNPRSPEAIAAQNARISQPQIAGGQGQFGGKGPGDSPPNPYGRGNVSFDQSGNRLLDGKIVQFAGTSAYNQYLSDRGLSNNGIVVDQGKYQNADWSQIPGYDSAAQVAFNSSQKDRPKSYTENYGYTPDVKVSAIVAGFSAKDPTMVNFDLEKNKAAIQARGAFAAKFSKDQGGVVTPQSKDKSFGVSWANKQTDKIGVTIFSNQKEFYRDSSAELKAKQSEVEKAIGIYPSSANKDYATGGTKQPDYNSVVTLGKAQSVFGAGKTSFGYKEESPKQLVRGSQQEKETAAFDAFRASGGKAPTKSITLSENVNVTAKDEGAAKGSPVGTAFGTTLTDKDFRNMLGAAEKKGAAFLFISGNKQVGESSGARAYHDYVGLRQKYGSDLAVSIFYPQREKGIINSVRQNPELYGNLSNSFWQRMGKAGYVSPQGMQEINSIIFSHYQPIEKRSTLEKSSILPTELANAKAQSYTGGYFDIASELGYSGTRLGKPITTDTKLGFGINAPTPFEAIRETSQNAIAFFASSIKTLPETTYGVATYLGEKIEGKSNTRIAANPNAFVSGILNPSPLWSNKTRSDVSAIQTTIHGFAKEHGISGILPQEVANPKTAGAEFGKYLGAGIMAYGLKDFAPFSREPLLLEGKVMAKMPSGEGLVEVPGTMKVSGVSLGFGGKYSIGLGMKANEGTKIPFVSTLRPETPYMKSILSKMEASSERGFEAGSTTKMTYSKIYTPKGAQILSDLGVITRSQQEELINLGKEVSIKGDIGKIKDVKTSKSVFESQIGEMGLTGNKEVNKQTISVLGANQGRFGFVPEFKGSLVNVGQLNAFNRKLAIESAGQYSSFISQPYKEFPVSFPKSEEPIATRPVPSIKDLDADLNKRLKSEKLAAESGEKTFKNTAEYKKLLGEEKKQSTNIFNLLTSKVKTPKGEKFTNVRGLNIGYEKAGESKEVLNLLGIRDEINTETSRATKGRSFGVEPPKGKVRPGDLLTTRTIGFQTWAKMKSVLSYQSIGTLDKMKNAATPEIYEKTMARFEGKKNIVRPPFIRDKDVVDLFGTLKYGERTTKGKTSQRLGLLASNLEKHFTDIDWSIAKEQVSKTKYSFTKEARGAIAKESSGYSPQGTTFPKSSFIPISTSQSKNLPSTATSFAPSKGSISSRSPSSLLSSKSISPKSVSSKSSLASLGITSKGSLSSPKSKSSKSILSPSGRSPYSGFSGRPSYSPYSGYVGPSGRSPSSGSPASSSPFSPSVGSPFSPTSPSGSVPSILTPPSKTGKVPFLFGANIGKKRKYKTREGHTKLYQFGVKNPFATSLNINKKGRVF